MSGDRSLSLLPSRLFRPIKPDIGARGLGIWVQSLVALTVFVDAFSLAP
jgi:hypothetical protein